MKKLSFCLSFLALFALLGTAAAQEAAVAEDASCSWKPDFALTLDWSSRYVSKGSVVNPDPIASVNANISLKGFYVNIWAPFDMTDINRPERSGAYTNNRKWRAEEVDYQIGYSYTVDAENLGGLSDLTIDFSWNYWQYPRATFDDDQPLELAISLDNVLDPDSNFTLKLGTAFDYDLANYRWWGKVFADLGYKVTDKATVGICNTWYWGDKKFNRYEIADEDAEVVDVEMERDAINAAEIKLYASYDVTENITLSAFWAGAWAIDHETRAKWDADSPWNRRQNFWGGCAIDFSF